jgi:hypothetical protein
VVAEGTPPGRHAGMPAGRRARTRTRRLPVDDHWTNADIVLTQAFCAAIHFVEVHERGIRGDPLLMARGTRPGCHWRRCAPRCARVVLLLSGQVFSGNMEGVDVASERVSEPRGGIVLVAAQAGRRSDAAGPGEDLLPLLAWIWSAVAQ